MANAFKNAGASATGTSSVDVYTAGSGVTATVIGLTCANISSTDPILVDIKFYDASANNNFFLVKQAQLFLVTNQLNKAFAALDKEPVSSIAFNNDTFPSPRNSSPSSSTQILLFILKLITAFLNG